MRRSDEKLSCFQQALLDAVLDTYSDMEDAHDNPSDYHAFCLWICGEEKTFSYRPISSRYKQVVFRSDKQRTSYVEALIQKGYTPIN